MDYGGIVDKVESAMNRYVGDSDIDADNQDIWYICDSWNDDKIVEDFDSYVPRDTHLRKMNAQSAIDAYKEVLAEAGMVIVPGEPTQEMISAANRMNHPRDEEVWRTMIAAAPDQS